MRKILSFLLILALVFVFAYPAKAGMNDRFSEIELTEGEWIYFPQISAPTGNPSDNTGWLYVKDNGGTTQLYFEDDAGGVTSWGGSTAWDDLGAPDANESLDMTTYKTEWDFGGTVDMFTLYFTGDFADVSGMVLEQKDGNPTDGTILELKLADDDPDFLSMYNTTEKVNIDSDGVLTLKPTGSPAATLVFTPVGACTTAILITDTDYTNSISIADNNIIGTTAAIDLTDFDVSADGVVTLAPDDSPAAMIVLSPDAAVGIGLDASDANLTHAIDLGDNNITGGVATIGFTDFGVTADGLIVTTPDAGTGTGIDIIPSAALDIGVDLSDANIVAAIDIGANTIVSSGGVFAVDAAGDITCNDVNATGTVTGATVSQDNIVPASADVTPLGLDGTAGGAVEIGLTSTGTIQLGADGAGATLVSLPNTVDLTMAGGQFSITDNQNADVFTLVNNTLTTQELMNVSSTSLTDGKGIQLTLAGQVDGHALYIENTDATLNAGTYIYAHDGTDDVFSVSKHGAVYIMGDATGADALTIDDGDITVTSGDVTVTAGDLIVTTGDITIATDGDIKTAKGAIQVDSTDPDNSHIKRNDGTTTGPVLVVEATNVADDDSVLELVQSATGGELTLEMSSDATGPMISATTTIAAADGILWTVPASYTGQLIKADLLAWLGTTGEGGVIDIVTTAAATQEVGQAIRLNFLGTGTAGTAVQGKGLHIHSNAAIKTDESLIYLDNLTNWGIHWNPNGTTADGIGIDVQNAFAGQFIVFDGGPWLGTAGEGGVIDFVTDNVGTAEAGYAIKLNFQGTAADAAGISGKGIYIKDTAGATASYLVHIESTNNGALVTTGDIDFTASWLRGASPLVFEGATEDANDLTLAVTDFESATTMTIPDPPVNSDIPVVIAVGTTTDQEGAAATETIEESVITIPAAHAAAGQVYKWECTGIKTGANNTYSVQLDLDGNNVLTLTASSAVAADYVCYITMHQLNATNSQKIHGVLLENGKVAVTDYATAAIDISGGVDVGLELVLVNAGDNITVESVIVEYNQ